MLKNTFQESSEANKNVYGCVCLCTCMCVYIVCVVFVCMCCVCMHCVCALCVCVGGYKHLWVTQKHYLNHSELNSGKLQRRPRISSSYL